MMTRMKMGIEMRRGTRMTTTAMRRRGSAD
jgi:hypothetical protein